MLIALILAWPVCALAIAVLGAWLDQMPSESRCTMPKFAHYRPVATPVHASLRPMPVCIQTLLQRHETR